MTPLPLRSPSPICWARKRQTLVSIGGVMLGVAVFIGIGGMMNGFHSYFLSQLVDTNPHIVISDEIRQARSAAADHPPTRGRRRGPARPAARSRPRHFRGLRDRRGAERNGRGRGGADLSGQAILRHAGRDYSVTAIGVDAPREPRVTDIVHDMVAGDFAALAATRMVSSSAVRSPTRWGSASATASPR